VRVVVWAAGKDGKESGWMEREDRVGIKFVDGPRIHDGKQGRKRIALVSIRN